MVTSEPVEGRSGEKRTVDSEGADGAAGGSAIAVEAPVPACNSSRASSASGLSRSTDVSSDVASAVRPPVMRLRASMISRSVLAATSACLATMASRDDARNAVNAFFMSSALA